ncbi:hypothetical protein MYP_3424 [Sporocytophaga myxococcoides]|uniref:Uncharacterized protein n=1 Tax=Sporocytophaga myxococcoides TaxID=153721 RepID=A0A098LGT9_9BACT|nr:hypothetical protein MYP_3424 [Sporocytophaga myxococcoides]
MKGLLPRFSSIHIQLFFLKKNILSKNGTFLIELKESIDMVNAFALLINIEYKK